MLLNNTMIIAGVIFEFFAFHPVMFIIGRILVGINSGINTVVIPMYLSEISPVNLRGSMGVCHQMAVISTILFSQQWPPYSKSSSYATVRLEQVEAKELKTQRSLHEFLKHWRQSVAWPV